MELSMGYFLKHFPIDDSINTFNLELCLPEYRSPKIMRTYFRYNRMTHSCFTIRKIVKKRITDPKNIVDTQHNNIVS